MGPRRTNVRPGIQTMPLPAEAKGLLSRAIRLVLADAEGFVPVGAWLDQHYSEAALRGLCQRRYRQSIAGRLLFLRLESPTFNRRLAIQRGRPIAELKRQTIREAHLGGQRLTGTRLVTRHNGQARSDQSVVDHSNVEVVWAWEDQQYSRRFGELKAERRAATMAAHDHPDRPGWRLWRAVEDIVAAEYPNRLRCGIGGESCQSFHTFCIMPWTSWNPMTRNTSPSR
jgi:hypothetical protein